MLIFCVYKPLASSPNSAQLKQRDDNELHHTRITLDNPAPNYLESIKAREDTSWRWPMAIAWQGTSNIAGNQLIDWKKSKPGIQVDMRQQVHTSATVQN